VARKTVKARKPKSPVVADRRRKVRAPSVKDEPIEVRADVIDEEPAQNSLPPADEPDERVLVSADAPDELAHGAIDADSAEEPDDEAPALAIPGIDGALPDRSLGADGGSLVPFDPLSRYLEKEIK